ncbi:tyrosine phosphatase family-domain-containing protein [Limtongia smithiae]|uniref:tyrosine phosphatase family-domain-containing protein n=1 Tax=Limtongia smithiae TaxID=1125753 RepID=UPI0034CD0A06
MVAVQDEHPHPRPLFTERRVEIPFSLPSSSRDGCIVGTLTSPSLHHDPHPLRQAVLIVHGFGGHRNYCYQKLLAHALACELGLYSLRFDFRNCGESAEIVDNEGKGRTLDEDVRDLCDVAGYLKTVCKLEILAIVGHSRGVIASLTYAAHHAPQIPYLINCSSRFRAHKIVDKARAANPRWSEDGGYWASGVARHLSRERVFIPAAETLSLSTPDMRRIVTELASAGAEFLCVYGANDVSDFVEDAASYANLLGRRNTLRLIKHADHNFYAVEHEKRVNFNPVVVEYIVEWLSSAQRQARFADRSEQVLVWSRWKELDGVVNFRDIGGLNVGISAEMDVRYMRTDYIFRSATLKSLSTDGIASLHDDLGITKIFDLRSTHECAKDGVYSLPPTIIRVHCPFADNQDESIGASASALLAAGGDDAYVDKYTGFLRTGRGAFRMVFEHILNAPEEPFLVHCTAGKDRTGVLVALLLLAAGVDADATAR